MGHMFQWSLCVHHNMHKLEHCLGCMSKLDKWIMEDKVVTVQANSQ